jgi:hypothetical protein
VIKSQPSDALHIEALAPPAPDFDGGGTDDRLISGGDGRLRLDASGLNRYGCPVLPDPALADFGSSTASVISQRGYAAADALHARLRGDAGPAAYRRELERVRGELRALNGLADRPDIDVVFAASGTDLHLLVRELVGGTPAAPLLCLGAEADETGRGVPAALAGRSFSDRAALGGPVEQGAPISPGGGEFVGIRARTADGALREAYLVEEELDALCLQASKSGQRVLLTVTDVSKTGLIFPSLETVLALRRRFPRTLEVLIDACQFRLSGASLRAYLDNDLMVAVTGSKFLTGPVFSGALFTPATTAERLGGRLLSAALRPYSARADWPEHWAAGRALNDASNPGLLLRWEAALAELGAFRAVPDAAVEAFASRFAEAVQTRIDSDPLFEPLAQRPLDRRVIGAAASWDQIPTIFPFLLRERPGDDAPYLSLAAMEHVDQALKGSGARLGQPVLCGERDGAPISALRLCNSARLIVEGVADPQGVISRAMGVLDQAAAVAARMAQAGRIYSCG